MHVSEYASEASSVAIFEAGYNSAASISYDLLPDATAHRPEEYHCSEHADTGPGTPATWEDASPVRDDPVVIDLVTRARDGDQQAWDALVERYAPLIWSICRRYRLGGPDAEDVAQSVWLQLVNHLDKIRDPAALPGWLATTTRRACGRVVRGPRACGYVPDAALREAFGDLPAFCQQLITLLIADPAVPYAEISAGLGIPIGSIGPYRSRCLDKLRRHPAIAALIATCES